MFHVCVCVCVIWDSRPRRTFDGDEEASVSARSAGTSPGEPPALLRALQGVASHCQSQLCTVAQRPLMGAMEGRIAGEEATRVTTAATLAAAPEATGVCGQPADGQSTPAFHCPLPPSSLPCPAPCSRTSAQCTVHGRHVAVRSSLPMHS